MSAVPMLAESFSTHADRVRWPWLCQPKLNGVRCLAWLDFRDQVQLTSRQGRAFHGFDTLREAVRPYLTPDLTLDGELYRHGVPLARIAAQVRRGDEADLELWLFDSVGASGLEPIEARLRRLPTHGNGWVRTVPTRTVVGRAELELVHAAHVAAGYEGTMLRRPGSVYTMGRSPDLLKHKGWREAEFPILGGRGATGEHEGAVVFQCGAPGGARFWCAPGWPLAERRAALQELHRYVGRPLTVRYLDDGPGGVPLGGAVGLAVRDYE